MNKSDARVRGGPCCSHCSDSKYPCVNMERLMRREVEESANTEESEKE